MFGVLLQTCRLCDANKNNQLLSTAVPRKCDPGRSDFPTRPGDFRVGSPGGYQLGSAANRVQLASVVSRADEDDDGRYRHVYATRPGAFQVRGEARRAEDDDDDDEDLPIATEVHDLDSVSSDLDFPRTLRATPFHAELVRDPTEITPISATPIDISACCPRCQSRRNGSQIRKGVHKVAKFFQRGRRNSNNNNLTDEPSVSGTLDDNHQVLQPPPPPPPPPPTATTTIPILPPRRSRASQRQQSLNEQQLPQPQQQRVRSSHYSPDSRRGPEETRRSWWRRQQRRPEASMEMAQHDGASAIGLEVPTSALPSLETAPPALIRSRRVHQHRDVHSTPLTCVVLRDQIHNSSSRHESAKASLVGMVDPVGGLEAGVMPADVVAYIDDYDPAYSKQPSYRIDPPDEPILLPCREKREHLDSRDMPTPLPDKSGSVSSISRAVPLSQARLGQHGGCDTATVYNDTLKVMVVAAPDVSKSWLARALANCQTQPKECAILGVDIHDWTPDHHHNSSAVGTSGSTGAHQGISESSVARFKVWDVHGPTDCTEESANFGAHPATQSLFFSGQSLYILASDLSWDNPLTHTRPHESDDEDDNEFSNDDEGKKEGELSPFDRPEALEEANQALRADFTQRVLSWVDTIARRGPNSAILPVAIVPPGMSEAEVQRRCHVLHALLKEHFINHYDSEPAAPKLLSGPDSNILRVDEQNCAGVDRLQETMIAITSSTNNGSVFKHMGAEVPPSTMRVLESVRYFKEEKKLMLISLDYFLAHLQGDQDQDAAVPVVLKALQFLADIGEIMYFGSTNDEVLSRYIVLRVSALTSILREVKHVLAARHCGPKHEQNKVIRALVTKTESSCPLLNKNDKMLWQSMRCMPEISDRSSELPEGTNSAPTMFQFFERLLVYMGILMPLGRVEDTTTLKKKLSEVFFVPGLLAQADPRASRAGEVWSYKSMESWTTTLCHSWLFRDGVPSNLMEHLTVNVLRDIYALSKKNNGGTAKRDREQPELLCHDQDAIGRVKIYELICSNSSLLIKLGTLFADHESGKLRDSFVEVFVTIVDQSANHCVASDSMRANMQRVIVSGKGQVGHHGRKIWKGGYEVILKSVRESLACCSNVDFQIVCPECLARSNPRSASTLSWDSVYARAQTGSSVVRCMRGDRLDCNLLCGTSLECWQPSTISSSTHRGSKPVPDIFPSVVMVGLWDCTTKTIQSIGSGFVVDKRLGLVVTAAHVLFSMEDGRPYFGLKDARVVIGVIPDDGNEADFRYFGDIIVDDIHNVDACVVQIKARIDDEGAGCSQHGERNYSLDAILDKQLKPLKMTSQFELEENIRIVGYNQGGEGVYEQGTYVNRSADFANGYICRTFQAPHPCDCSDSGASFVSIRPRQEIVIICPTISGHSGGPCVNNEGKVVGIVSRADPVDRYRCYLVPTSELKKLVKRATSSILHHL